MGPFPHHRRTAAVSAENPAGTDGFAFVEFAHPEPQQLRDQFRAMGFAPLARHRQRAIELWQQGDIIFLINAAAAGHGRDFCAAHGPCAPSMGWWVVDAQAAYRHALAQGARAHEGAHKCIDAPAILGIGGSLLYFVERPSEGPALAGDFEWSAEPGPPGRGFYYLDHLTHNVHQGQMDVWFHFYRRLFNFREIRFFDIEGKYTGLYSRALTSPCGKIRIPINEDRSSDGQIEAYLKKYKGEGIQHIALGSDDLYRSVDAIHAAGVRFMKPPPSSYYPMSLSRVPGHGESLEALARHGILIDGEGVVDGGETRVLLQIFSRTMIGPIFFEFIQRKGDDGFGEGNFKALFESIEAQQIADGELRTG